MKLIAISFKLRLCQLLYNTILKYSRTPLIRIKLDGGPSGYAENPDNFTFLWKQETLAVWRSAIYSMYLHLNISTTP